MTVTVEKIIILLLLTLCCQLCNSLEDDATFIYDLVVFGASPAGISGALAASDLAGTMNLRIKIPILEPTRQSVSVKKTPEMF